MSKCSSFVFSTTSFLVKVASLITPQPFPRSALSLAVRFLSKSAQSFSKNSALGCTVFAPSLFSRNSNPLRLVPCCTCLCDGLEIELPFLAHLVLVRFLVPQSHPLNLHVTQSHPLNQVQPRLLHDIRVSFLAFKQLLLNFFKSS